MQFKLQVQLAYGIPSMLLYGVIFSALIRKRKTVFNSAFWSLFFTLGIVECLAWAITYALFRLPNGGVFIGIYRSWPSNNFFAGKFMFAGYYIHLTQMLANTMISLNRFTAIVLPRKHDKVWNRSIKIAIAFVFFAPLSVTWHNLTYAGTWWTPDNQSYYLRTDGGVQWISNSVVSMSVGSAMAITGFFLNIFAGLTLVKQRLSAKQQQQNWGNSTTATEIKLFVLSLIMFVSQVLLIIYDILIELFSPPEFFVQFFTTFNQLGWLVDFSCISNPWLILVASKSLRVEVLRLLFGNLFAMCHGAVSDAPMMSKVSNSLAKQQNSPHRTI